MATSWTDLRDRRATLVPALMAMSDEMVSSGERRRLTELAQAVDSLEDAADVGAASDDRLAGWLAVGELAGTPDGSPLPLGEVLKRIDAASADTLRRFPWTSLAYPTTVLLLSLAVFTGVSLLLVPPFEQLFNDFGLSLPVPTLVVIGMSHLLRTPGFWFVLAILAVVVAGLMAIRFRYGEGQMPWSGRVRLAGSITELRAMSRFAGRLAELAAAGIPVGDSLRRAGRDCGHRGLSRAADQLAAEGEARGGNWSAAPAAGRFPGNLLLALGGGDGFQTPDPVLLRALSDMYGERVWLRADSGSTFWAVLIVLFAGFVIGLIFLSLFLPLIDLITVLA